MEHVMTETGKARQEKIIKHGIVQKRPDKPDMKRSLE
jgi:hypothetical protein